MKKNFSTVLGFNIAVCSMAACFIIFAMTYLKWKPCPLCLMQQFSLLATLILSIFAILSKVKFRFVLILLICIFISVGVYYASKQIYIQHMPELVASDAYNCADSTNAYVLKTTQALVGSVESCANDNDKIVGVGLPYYSVVFFSGMLLINIFSIIINFFKMRKTK